MIRVRFADYTNDDQLGSHFISALFTYDEYMDIRLSANFGVNFASWHRWMSSELHKGKGPEFKLLTKMWTAGQRQMLARHDMLFCMNQDVLQRGKNYWAKMQAGLWDFVLQVSADILNVDAVGLWLVRRPEEFGVIVAENMFGDILSDVGAGVMGGLGFAPSANIGERGCYFEPVHGSAPRIKAHEANPSAMFLTIALLLHHFGYKAQAEKIKQSVMAIVKERRFVSYDLGGNSTTEEMAEAIITYCI